MTRSRVVERQDGDPVEVQRASASLVDQIGTSPTRDSDTSAYRFCRELGLLLEQGMPLDQGLKRLEFGADRATRALLRDIPVQSGRTGSETAALELPAAFPEWVRLTVRCAAPAELAVTLDRISTSLASQIALRQAVAPARLLPIGTLVLWSLALTWLVPGTVAIWILTAVATSFLISPAWIEKRLATKLFGDVAQAVAFGRLAAMLDCGVARAVAIDLIIADAAAPGTGEEVGVVRLLDWLVAQRVSPGITALFEHSILGPGLAASCSRAAMLLDESARMRSRRLAPWLPLVLAADATILVLRLWA